MTVRSYEYVKNLIETPDYSPWFSARNGEKMILAESIPSERTTQGEQNDANLTCIAPSSEEL